MNLVILPFDELEAEGLIPADGEDIERDLTSDRVLQVQISEFLLKFRHKCLANVSSLIEFLELISL